MSGKKTLDGRNSRHERAGELRQGRRADDYQQGHAVTHHRVAFVRLIADTSVMRERNPAAPADRR